MRFEKIVCLSFCFVGCKTSYNGATYNLVEVRMLNKNGSEDSYEEYLEATGIDEKKIESIKNHYGIEISDTTTLKAFLLKYISAKLEFVDSENVIFTYGFNTYEEGKLGVSTRYAFSGTYEIVGEGLSIFLLNYEYKKNGDIVTDASGVYQTKNETKLLGTIYGDMNYNITVDGKNIRMDLYTLLEDGTETNNVSFIFKKV